MKCLMITKQGAILFAIENGKNTRNLEHCRPCLGIEYGSHFFLNSVII
jgi:hypothetical protein